jgi:hypothetical protein
LNKVKLLKNNKAIVSLIISILIIIILDGSLTIFCVPRSNRIFNISNTQLYLIYFLIFIASNIIILKIVKNTISNLKQNKSFYIILIIQSLLSITLITIYGEMNLYSSYHDLFIFLIVYASLLSSVGFLSILAFKLLHWFSLTPNYLILIYGVAIILFIFNTVIGLIYLTEVIQTHKDIIKPTSCRALFGSLFHINPTLSIFFSNLYDITSIFSFIVVWIGTTIMLKQYTRTIGKIKYWLLVSIPLVFFLTKYEIMFYYFINDPTIFNFLSIKIDPHLNPLVDTILNSNLEIGGLFFAIVFLVIAKKIPKRHEIVNSLIISLFGMMFLFASKDISTLIIQSYPPLGIVSISFMGLASYLLLVGIYNSATIAARDVNLRKYLANKLENDTTLLMNIAFSEKETEVEKNVKSLFTYSEQWQQDNRQLEMTQQQIKEVINDVISEVKKDIPKKGNTTKS